MCEDSPRSTHPISRTSRLSARPRSPPSNSSSSLVMAECRPSTRAMPSPVSVTMPTSSRLALASYEETMLSSASRISSGRMLNSVTETPSFRVSQSGPAATAGEMAAGGGEMAQHTRVEQLVAHADSDSADELRVDDHAQTHLVAELARERVGKPLLLIFGE